MNIDLVTKTDLQSFGNILIEQVQQIFGSAPAAAKSVYTTKELANKLKVSTKTINNWREARLIEYCKIHGVILFTEAAVSEFLANHTIKRKGSLFTSKPVHNG